LQDVEYEICLPHRTGRLADICYIRFDLRPVCALSLKETKRMGLEVELNSGGRSKILLAVILSIVQI
jgi:hypothetical protein